VWVFVGLRNFLAASETSDDVVAKVLDGVAGSREDPAANPVAFVQHPEEDMLGLDGARSELTLLRFQRRRPRSAL
jgi:hypothetical protein